MNRPVRLMPLGDSITRGLICPAPGFIPGGYRTRLYHRLANELFPVEFVGSANDNPDPGNLPSPAHEGHGGWRIDEIEAGIGAWLEAAQPDIILLHIGTNDMAQNYDVDDAPHRLAGLLAGMRTRVFVAQIIGSTDDAVRERIERYNAAIPDVAARHRATVVDMFHAVPLSDFADPYHPNAAGYGKIADTWFAAIARAGRPVWDGS
jgi:hypothetical protein